MLLKKCLAAIFGFAERDQVKGKRLAQFYSEAPVLLPCCALGRR
jgi:hypothetical protein